DDARAVRAASVPSSPPTPTSSMTPTSPSTAAASTTSSTSSSPTATTPTATTTTTTTSPSTTTTTLPGSGACSSPIAIPAGGGTFTGTTSGSGTLAGSCGSTGGAPERVYQWTPNVSGMATIQTCGAGTNFDTVLYIRNSPCATGSELPGGCNDDACTNSTGLFRASRLTPTVTAGQTYFIIVDGYS